MPGIGSDRSWNVSSRVDIRSHVRHCTDDNSFPSNTSLMIERLSCFVAANESMDVSDDGTAPHCLSVGSKCGAGVCCDCGPFIGDEFRLLMELERALFVDVVEWVDLNVLWLAVGLYYTSKQKTSELLSVSHTHIHIIGQYNSPRRTRIIRNTRC